MILKTKLIQSGWRELGLKMATNKL